MINGRSHRIAVVIRSVARILVPLFVAGACVFAPPGHIDDLGERIQASAADLPADETVNLTEALGSDWQRAVVISGYVTEDEIDETIGFEWSDAGRTGGRDNDGQLVVLIRDENVVAWAFFYQPVEFDLDPDGYIRFQPDSEFAVQPGYRGNLQLCLTACSSP